MTGKVGENFSSIRSRALPLDGGRRRDLVSVANLGSAVGVMVGIWLYANHHPHPPIEGEGFCDDTLI